MISEAALRAFKAIWHDQFGEDLPDDIAMEEAVNLLTMFDAIYKPLKQSDVDKYHSKCDNKRKDAYGKTA
jgi:hypothetical protein